MKALIAIMTILGVVAVAKAQVEPEATSPLKLGISGTLSYSARYMQMADFYAGGTSQMANLSGNFGYSTTSERHPTSLTFGAGDSWTLSGQDFNSGPYVSLSVSQSVAGQHWSLQLSDSVDYHKGVPIDQPNPTSSTAEPILTLNTSMVNNDVTATYSYKLSAFSTLSAGGGYNQLYYPDGNGISTNGLLANAGLNHRLDARNSLFGEYSFSRYSYSGSNVTIDANADISIDVNTAVAGWQRTWTRRVSTSVSAGPQWVTFNASIPAPSSTPPPSTPVPGFIGYSVNASATDTSELGAASLTYSHGVNGGGGYLNGAEVDDIMGSFSRHFGRQVRSQFTMTLSGGYRRTDALSPLTSAGLGAQGDYDSKYGNAQATRSLGRLFSAYAGYTATSQSSTSPASNVPLNGLFQTISFGIGFTPPQIHLRQ